MKAAHPTRRAMLAFRVKAAIFRARRAIVDLAGRGRRWPRVSRTSVAAPIAEVSTPLRPPASDLDAREAHLIAGKIENLRIAVRRIDGALVPANGIFSFWRQVGRASRAGGYVEGRELREGCIVPSTGGGLCQLSNALYGAALDAGCEIVERHAHSQIVPGSVAEAGRDATVFWNYVDLRFRPHHDLVIRARLEADRLVVRFYAAGVERDAVSARVPAVPIASGRSDELAASCASCDVTACSRHRSDAAVHAGRVAYLVDGSWPEYDAYVRERATHADLLCVPLDGARFRLPQYAWTTAPFGEIRQAPRETLSRAMRTRRLSSTGAARQRANIRSANRLARRYARALGPDVEHVVVAQTLLPFLWRGGHLGGRTFDVLMSSPPLRDLQTTLDAAARLHPESPTLADFRAGDALLDAEAEALARARTIVTPHAAVARRFGSRAHLLPWSEPRPASLSHTPSIDGFVVVFSASTLGRSGAYEMREAARRLRISLVLAGESAFEGANFWDGIDVRYVPDFEAALRHANVVALPAFVESRPRRLLAALAAGIPVIATAACGLSERSNVTTIPAGDVDALVAALRAVAPAEPTPAEPMPATTR